ncbi:tyrosine-type recombinase/integrase [Paracoccus sp. KR1-242]|uniref:tyrosine-type recombinase/integrase n=1 Tax=Paracoccus sp. KR1-242 TaxID=3410028 RepID=UPI003C0999DF
MKKSISDVLLRSLKAPETGRVEISDVARPGLRFRIIPSGKRTWIFEKRIKGGPKRTHTLGTYPETSIKSARAMALELELEATRGFDRIAEAEREAERKVQAELSATSVQRVLEAFDALHLANLRTGSEVRQSLLAAMAPYLSRDIASLNRKTLQGIIDAKAATGAKVQANRVKAYLSKFTKFAWQRGYIENHIGVGLEKACKEVSRDRVLTVWEVHEIWDATFKLSDIAGGIVRLLILTAQRKNEIARLTWDEVSAEQSWIELRGRRTKNGKAHITHLSGPAMKEIEARRGISDSPFLFTTTDKAPFSGFSSLKRQLDEHLRKDFEHWTLHDLRTAFATEMASRGELETVVDRILNHAASGSAPSAVARVYNRSQYLPERKRILNDWAAVVTGPRPVKSTKVIPFKAGAA